MAVSSCSRQVRLGVQTLHVPAETKEHFTHQKL